MFLMQQDILVKNIGNSEICCGETFQTKFCESKTFFSTNIASFTTQIYKKYLILFNDKVKGTVSRDFLEHFFHNFIPNGPLIHMPRYFRMLSRLRGDNCVWKGLRSAISYRHRESPAERCQWHAESVLMPNVVIYQRFFSLQFKIRNFWKN